MKLLIKLFFLAIVSISCFTELRAQTTLCITGLKEANQFTEKGKYDEAITLIKSTLENCTLSKNDKIQANKMLIINYLAIDNLEEAESVASIIMKIDPNYEPDKLRDEPELIALFQKYKPTVVLKGIIMSGFNISRVQASQTYSIVANNNSTELDNYQSNTGFQIAAGAEFRIVSSLWFQSCLLYRKSGYSIDIPNVQGRTISYQESLNYLDIPFAAKYYFFKNNFQPFVQVGVNLSFVNSALGELSRNDINDIIERTSQRHSFYAGYFGGIGLSYTIKEWSIQTGVNYLWNPKNLNKEGTRYDNADAVFKYYYIDNDFKMNNVLLNIGFTYALGYKNILTNKGK